MIQYLCILICIVLVSLFVNVHSFVFPKQWQVRLPTSSKMSTGSKLGGIKHELLIGNLPSTILESDLREFVSQKAPGIVNITLQPYQNIDGSYAFVEFSDFKLVQEAVGLLLGSTFAERPIDVSKRHNVSTLFMELEDIYETEDQLKLRLSELMGNTALKRVTLHARRGGRFGAYLDFETPQEAQLALFILSGLTYRDKSIVINFSVDSPDVTLFVGNLDVTLGNRQVHQMLSQILSGVAQVKQLRLPLNPAGGSKGIAFVEFHSPEEALRALKEIPQYKILDKQLKVDYLKYSTVCTDPTRLLYLHNIDQKVTSSQVVQMIEELLKEKDIVQSVIFKTVYHLSNCEVSFASTAVRDRAVQELQGVSLMGRQLRVSVTKIDQPVRSAGMSLVGSTRSLQRNASVIIPSDQIVFLKNIPSGVSSPVLQDWINNRLNGMHVLQVRRGNNLVSGVPLDYAHVYLSNAEDARQAQTLLHNVPFMGNVIQCSPARPKEGRFYPAVVLNLANDWSDTDLNGMLKSVLAPNLHFIKASMIKPSSGFTAEGVVFFGTMSARLAAMKRLSGLVVEGKTLVFRNVQVSNSTDLSDPALEAVIARTVSTFSSTPKMSFDSLSTAVHSPKSDVDSVVPLTAETVATPPLLNGALEDSAALHFEDNEHEQYVTNEQLNENVTPDQLHDPEVTTIAQLDGVASSNDGRSEFTNASETSVEEREQYVEVVQHEAHEQRDDIQHDSSAAVEESVLQPHVVESEQASNLQAEVAASHDDLKEKSLFTPHSDEIEQYVNNLEKERVAPENLHDDLKERTESVEDATAPIDEPPATDSQCEVTDTASSSACDVTHVEECEELGANAQEKSFDDREVLPESVIEAAVPVHQQVDADASPNLVSPEKIDSLLNEMKENLPFSMWPTQPADHSVGGD